MFEIFLNKNIFKIVFWMNVAASLPELHAIHQDVPVHSAGAPTGTDGVFCAPHGGRTALVADGHIETGGDCGARPRVEAKPSRFTKPSTHTNQTDE